MFFLLLLICSVSAQPYYWRFPHTDDESNHLGPHLNGSLSELAAACTARADCAGFNSHGWLKSSVAHAAPDSCDLYVKKDSGCHLS